MKQEVSSNSATFDPPPPLLSYSNYFTHGTVPPIPSTTGTLFTSFVSPISTVSRTSTIQHGLGRGSHLNRPAWQTSDKHPRLFPIFIQIFHLASSIKKPNANIY